MADTVVVAEAGEESSGYRFSWGLAFAGGVTATAVTFFLLTLGSGVGLLLVHPITHGAAVVPSFLTGGAIYFFVAQAFGFAVGGHLAGRLLGFEAETPEQEDFRAGAHGFASWAVTVLATLTMLALAGLTVASTGASTAALYGVAPAAVKMQSTPTAYLVDQLFRPARGAGVSASPGSVAARAEAGRILDAGLAHGEQVTADDHARLTALTAAEAGLSEDQASARIDRLQADVQAATRKAADIARKSASYASLWAAFSLLFGALVATGAAILARHEDDREVMDRR
jgi:hypothetical protein